MAVEFKVTVQDTPGIQDHRLHGTMTADATTPEWNGYLLTVACPGGSVPAVGDA